MASYEKSIECEKKSNKPSLKTHWANQSHRSDTKGKPSMGKSSHTVRIWKRHHCYKESIKAEVLFTVTDLCIALACEISNVGHYMSHQHDLHL